MKNKIAIITLSVVSTIAIGISVYSTVTLNQKYKELERTTQAEEIETEPIEVATDNYNQRFEDLNTKITELETNLSNANNTIENLTEQLNSYKNSVDTTNYINNLYKNASSPMDFSHSFGVGRFDMCMYFYANDIVPSEDSEYYSYCNFK